MRLSRRLPVLTTPVSPRTIAAVRLPSIFAFIGVLASAVVILVAAAPASAPEAQQDHRQPAVIRDASGEHAVKTTQEWAKRRDGILKGFQDVAGPLPDMKSLPPLDVKVTEQTKGDGYVRQSISYVSDGIQGR